MRFLLPTLILISSCSKEKPEPKIEDQERLQLEVVRENVRAWSEVCLQSAVKQNCDDGDSTLWNGLLCLSGEAQQCAALRASQTPDGRLWRSPRRVGVPDDNSFSRDMSMGFLAGQVGSPDAESFNKATAYVNEKKRLCPGDDGYCGVTPMIYALWNQVAKAKGFSKLDAKVVLHVADDVFSEIVIPKIPTPVGADDLTVVVSAKTAPAGFRLHLVGLHLLIRQNLSDWNSVLQEASAILSKREPENLFFAYLNKQNIAQRLINAAPKKSPEQRTQWSFERTDGEHAEQKSMGWDYLFLTNLVLKK
jgi:hypothetical protein